MILKDQAVDIGTATVSLWAFRIECDKCNGTLGVTMNSREETQAFIFKMGFRVNPRARKYVHLCKRCASKGRPKGQPVQ